MILKRLKRRRSQGCTTMKGVYETMRRVAPAVTISVFLILLLAILPGCGAIADRSLNKVVTRPPYTASPEAERLHKTLFVADLHADPLLWARSLLKRNSHGHVDVPRMREGNIGLQVFTTVTKVPWGVNVEKNTGKSDMITVLTISQLWPTRTWFNLTQRALYQSEKLERYIRKSEGALMLIAGKQDLEKLLEERRRGGQVIGALLGIEGAHALKGNIANLDKLYDRGFRLIGLNHHFDNEVAGSAHGVEKGGLTDLGREVVRRAQKRGTVIDLAHASPQAINEVLAMMNDPVVVSHTGVRSICESPRNLSDDQIRAIAKGGGVIGLGLFPDFMCGEKIDDTVKAMRHVADLVGVKHVALGSDWDGATTTMVDASGAVLVTEALMKAGFSDDDIYSIMGGNVLRVLREVLPERDKVREAGVNRTE